jgi:hypothetical protein
MNRHPGKFHAGDWQQPGRQQRDDTGCGDPVEDSIDRLVTLNATGRGVRIKF